MVAAARTALLPIALNAESPIVKSAAAVTTAVTAIVTNARLVLSVPQALKVLPVLLVLQVHRVPLVRKVL